VQHSISLHPTPPNPPVLVHGLTTLFRLLPLIRDPASEDYANEVALAVDQGIKDGWQYAPSGMDGIEMMVEIGMGVELLCKESGLGVVRWLNVSLSRCDNSELACLSIYLEFVRISSLDFCPLRTFRLHRMQSVCN